MSKNRRNIPHKTRPGDTCNLGRRGRQLAPLATPVIEAAKAEAVVVAGVGVGERGRRSLWLMYSFQAGRPGRSGSMALPCLVGCGRREE